MTRPLVICADDYAYSPSVCDAIIDLAVQGRISAISCMTTSRLWREQALRLIPLRGRVDIGLHLTLIEEVPLTLMPRNAPDGRMPSLATVMARSYAGTLVMEEFDAEIRAQCDAFVQALGFPPDHIDGHRHTHVLPGLRRLVLEEAARLAPRPWVRNIAEPVGRVIGRGVAVPKALLLSALGAGLKADATATGLRTNDGFSGVYSLAPNEDVAGLFARFVAETGPCPMIMCHPGKADETPLGATRAKEYDVLSGDVFPALLTQHGLHIGRLAA